MTTGRPGVLGSTPGELAYAHLGATRVAGAVPRWPARLLFIESPSAPGHPGDGLAPHGLEVRGYDDGIGALLALAEEDPVALVAPTDLAHVDFLSFVEGVTAMTDVAVIVGLGSHDAAHELAFQALQRGARSILALPSTSEQLLSAVRSCGIRAVAAGRMLEIGELRLDPQSFRATVAGHVVELTPREFLMVQHLMLESPRVVSVEELARALATYDDGSISATRVLVTRVRKKLERAAPGAGHVIETVRSIGYRISTD
ncbi:response regulator transcription factor [Agromyces sp. H66]|uniref:winged helix-turn-helix transcriptional regulator n=1 Tax=Agromyces sp. H66 TaxID=2529859 RepID=UPI0010AA4219|nr:response regulator transcription factor [Agromyces sp. H66]